MFCSRARMNASAPQLCEEETVRNANTAAMCAPPQRLPEQREVFSLVPKAGGAHGVGWRGADPQGSPWGTSRARSSSSRRTQPAPRRATWRPRRPATSAPRQPRACLLLRKAQGGATPCWQEKAKQPGGGGSPRGRPAVVHIHRLQSGNERGSPWPYRFGAGASGGAGGLALGRREGQREKDRAVPSWASNARRSIASGPCYFLRPKNLRSSP